MGSGNLQIAAIGERDLYLTSNPQVTYFKQIYRRFTNFSLEVVKQTFISKLDFGKKASVVIARNADLIKNITLVIDLPEIPTFRDDNGENDLIAKFRWVQKIGYQIIDFVEIEIGNEIIDKHFGDWLNIYDQLTNPKSKQIDDILGNIKEMTDLSNGKKNYRLYIPLQFWFNRSPGLSLPICCLQYNTIKVNVSLNDLQKCYVVSPTHYIEIDNDFVNFSPYEILKQNINGVISYAEYIYFDITLRRLYISRINNVSFSSVQVSNLSDIPTESAQDDILYQKDSSNNFVNQSFFIIGEESSFRAMPKINSNERVYANNSINFNTIRIDDAFLLVEYIYLSSDERKLFQKKTHEYLIEQVVYNGEQIIDGNNQTFNIGFTKSCKELIWVTQLSEAKRLRNNQYFNYTNSLIKETGNNIIENETILYNGRERISERESRYYDTLQHYQYHKGFNDSFINSFSFSLFPEDKQPSGSSNLSKIENIALLLNVNPEISSSNTAILRVYAIINNIFKIEAGISGLVFASDTQL